MTQTFSAERVLEYPGGYTRSVGPVIGRFLTGLRDGRILGVRLADGRVLVPPTEYDPATSAPVASEGDHWVEVGPIGTVHMAFIGKYTRFEDLAPDSYGQHMNE